MSELFTGPIGNSISITTARYAAILGASPSKGARSPLLWNAAFAAAGIDAVMHPMDTTAETLGAVVATLKADPRYMGGAVTMPHKQAIVAYLDRLEPEAERIGAVNAIWRDDDGALVGGNTDGAGALACWRGGWVPGPGRPQRGSPVRRRPRGGHPGSDGTAPYGRRPHYGP